MGRRTNPKSFLGSQMRMLISCCRLSLYAICWVLTWSQWVVFITWPRNWTSPRHCPGEAGTWWSRGSCGCGLIRTLPVSQNVLLTVVRDVNILHQSFSTCFDTTESEHRNRQWSGHIEEQKPPASGLEPPAQWIKLQHLQPSYSRLNQQTPGMQQW